MISISKLYILLPDDMGLTDTPTYIQFKIDFG